MGEATERHISKTARNEETKLRATFRNNLAVATIAGGCLVPLLALYTRPFHVEKLAGNVFVLTPEDAAQFVFSLVAALVAFFTGYWLHTLARRLIATVTD